MTCCFRKQKNFFCLWVRLKCQTPISSLTIESLCIICFSKLILRRLVYMRVVALDVFSCKLRQFVFDANPNFTAYCKRHWLISEILWFCLLKKTAPYWLMMHLAHYAIFKVLWFDTTIEQKRFICVLPYGPHIEKKMRREGIRAEISPIATQAKVDVMWNLFILAVNHNIHWFIQIISVSNGTLPICELRYFEIGSVVHVQVVRLRTMTFRILSVRWTDPFVNGHIDICLISAWHRVWTFFY